MCNGYGEVIFNTTLRSSLAEMNPEPIMLERDPRLIDLFSKTLRLYNCNIYGKEELFKDRDPLEIKFYYTPTMLKQHYYKKLPYLLELNTQTKIVDAFSTNGEKFGLRPLEVFVEIKTSEMGGRALWAEIYYVADSMVPVLIINLNKISYFK
jgi:hypothetical protein